MTQIFLILAGVAVVGLAFILLVPHRRQRPTVIAVDPSTPVKPEAGATAGRP